MISISKSSTDIVSSCPTCDSTILIDSTLATNQTYIHCATCQYKYCYQCNVQWHTRLTCDEYQYALNITLEQRNGNDTETAT